MPGVRRPAPSWQLSTIVEMQRGMTDEEALRFLTTGETPADPSEPTDETTDDDEPVDLSEGDVLALLAGVPIGGFVAGFDPDQPRDDHDRRVGVLTAVTAADDSWKTQLRAPRGTPIGGQWVDEIGGMIGWIFKPSGKPVKPTPTAYKKGRTSGTVAAIRADGNAILRIGDNDTLEIHSRKSGNSWELESTLTKSAAHKRVRGDTGEEWHEPDLKPLSENDDESGGFVERQEAPVDVEKIASPASDTAPAEVSEIGEPKQQPSPSPSVEAKPNNTPVPEAEPGLGPRLKATATIYRKGIQDGEVVAQTGDGERRLRWDEGRKRFISEARDGVAWNETGALTKKDAHATIRDEEWFAPKRSDATEVSVSPTEDIAPAPAPMSMPLSPDAERFDQTLLSVEQAGNLGPSGMQTLALASDGTTKNEFGRGDMPENVRKAIASYTFSPGANNMLRESSGDVTGLPESARDRVFALDEGFRLPDAKLSNDLITFRGVNDVASVFPGLNTSNDLTGTKIRDHGFTSSSLEEDVARSFTSSYDDDAQPVIFRVHVPEGMPAVGILGVESEVLLPRGSEFTVVRDNGVDPEGFRRLDVTVKTSAPPESVQVPQDALDARARFDRTLAEGLSGDDALDSVPYAPENVDTPDDISAAIEVYSDLGYYVNTELRKSAGDVNAVTSDKRRKMVEDLEAGFAESRLPNDVIVWRGFPGAHMVFDDAWSDDDLTGLEWTDAGYGSTSTDENVAKNFAKSDHLNPALIRVRVPKGTPALAVKSDEDEIILPRNSRYQVVRDNGVDENGLRRLDVEVTTSATPEVTEPVTEMLQSTPASAPQSSLRSAYDSGFEVEEKFGFGQNADSVERLRLSDGRQAVRKKLRKLKSGLSTKNQARNEVIVGEVATAFGLGDLRVEKLSDSEILMSFVEGDVGVLVPEAPSVSAQRPGGKEIAILDWITHNSDRTAGNWILAPDGSVKPIDHSNVPLTASAAKKKSLDNALMSPFVDYWLNPVRSFKWDPIKKMKPRLTRDDVSDARQRLESLRTAFKDVGETPALELMLKRLARLEEFVQ